MAEFTLPSFLENHSVDENYEKMMSIIPADIDKSEGSHTWNMTIGTAYFGAYFAEFIIPEALKLIWPMYSENHAKAMEDHAKTRGLVRRSATQASGELTITGAAGTEIPAGTMFTTTSVDDEPAVEFVTTAYAKIGPDESVTVDILAVSAGKIGNVAENTIILKANKITGITGCTNKKEITGGTEQETIESLQARINEYDAMQGMSFVGSPSDYKRWAMSVDGVGNAIVIGAEGDDDSGLVTIVLTDSNGDPASELLLTSVYDYIMRPDTPSERLAPINAYLSVIPPETIELNIAVTIELEEEVSIEDVKTNLLAALKTYLAEAAEAHEIRWTKIGSVISKVTGVADYKDLLVNGDTANIAIADTQVAVVEEDNLNLTTGKV